MTATRTRPGALATPETAPPDQADRSVVRLDGVGRHFGDTDALRDLSFSVPPGQITVLVGPNGAGKTTAIRVITGALEIHAGTVRTFGCDPVSDGETVRARCGVVSAKPALYDRMTGLDNLRYAAELNGMGRGPDIDASLTEAAAGFDIDISLDDLVGGYSTGMKTRLALARAIIASPDLLLLDEPTSGLDPESSVAVLAMIRDMTATGRTVVVCTHLLAEAEGLADHVVVLNEGTDAIKGSPGELVSRYWPNPTVQIGTEEPLNPARLRSVPGVRAVESTPDLAADLVVTLDDERRVPDVVTALVAEGVRVRHVSPHQPTLEDLYFAIRRNGVRP